MSIVQTEPVLTVGAIVAVITAGLQFLRLMGWLSLTDEQSDALMTFVSLLLPLLGALWARSKVTPLTAPKDADGVALVRKTEYPQ